MIKYNMYSDGVRICYEIQTYTCVYNNWCKDNMDIGWHIALNEIH